MYHVERWRPLWRAGEQLSHWPEYIGLVLYNVVDLRANEKVSCVLDSDRIAKYCYIRLLESLVFFLPLYFLVVFIYLCSPFESSQSLATIDIHIERYSICWLQPCVSVLGGSSQVVVARAFLILFACHSSSFRLFCFFFLILYSPLFLGQQKVFRLDWSPKKKLALAGATSSWKIHVLAYRTSLLHFRSFDPCHYGWLWLTFFPAWNFDFKTSASIRLNNSNSTDLFKEMSQRNASPNVPHA